MVEEIPEGATAAGNCHRCGAWSAVARVVAEIHGAAGAGGTVVRCLVPCERPPVAQRARTYPR